jgi:hypothetical protein
MPFVVTTAGPTTETLVLDPTTEDADNSPLELISTTGNFLILAHSYPAPPLDVLYASNADTEGDIPGSSRYRNRTITLTVDCRTYNALMALQAKVAKIAREGGTLQRTLPWGETITFDLLATDGYEPQFEQQFYSGVTTVNLAFPAKPFGRGPEVTLSQHASSTPGVIFTETDIAGDQPALGRLTVTSSSGSSANPVYWGLQSRTYTPDAGSLLYYGAEAMTLVSGTLAVGPTGATGTGNNVVKHTSLSPGGVFLLSFELAPSFGALTHVGSFRVFARVHTPTTNAGTVTLQLSWNTTGSSSISVVNDAATYPPDNGDWRLLDLGQITIPKSTRATQIWDGTLRAASTVTGDDIEVDSFLFLPITEGAAELGTPDELALPGHLTVENLEIRHDGADRTGVFGTTTRAIRVPVQGDNLLIPPAGPEGRTLRMVVWGTGELGDEALPLTATLAYTPRYLVIPST